MSAKTTQQPTLKIRPEQTPFEKFKAAVSKVMSVPKSSLPKTPKKHKK
jgi:hypothetical protein